MNIERNQWQMLGLAIEIIATAFAGKTDKGGKPYILHCLHVMNHVNQNDPELMQIAVMHDLLEDCRDTWDLSKLQELGFSNRVLEALDLLNHLDEWDYLDVYIVNIAKNPDAKAVKREDLKHNSCVTRTKGLREKDVLRLTKYIRAFEYLKD